MADETATELQSATTGFDALFANDIVLAREIFSSTDSPFHILGAGVCAFLEAALGMESGLMAQATQLLAEADSRAKKQLKIAKATKSSTRFPAGTEWELLQSDSVILHALTLALRLYKTVYPSGLDNYATPATSKLPSPSPSIHSESSSTHVAKQPRPSFFGRFTGSNLTTQPNPVSSTPDGPVEELIMSGTAFGYGGVVGFLGFKHDRKLALRALAVSANQTDVHAVFSGLVLMTYYGVVLLLSGYQADEQHILKQYLAMIDHVESRYPTGSLWILNRAKLLRMSYDTEGAIKVLQDGLKPDRPHSFLQADGLLVFELAWTLLSQRRYEEAAQTFIRITEINSWSHATYYFIAAGCYTSIKNFEKAQELLDAIPDLIDKKKIGGKDLPTEVFIKKKLAFYKEKQKRRTGSEADYVHSIKISPAEVWNTHARIGKEIAHAHIAELCSLSPPVEISSPLTALGATPTLPSNPPDLDTPDELAVRSLILGIVHRTAGEYPASREFLVDAHKRHSTVKISTWVGGVACFELAVLDLKEAEAKLGGDDGVGMDSAKKAAWMDALKAAGVRLDQALALAPQSVDLSSRLDTRISMLRDEMSTKRETIERV
ncbi:hypothetical protein PHLCEN_2v7793 [Hermanssonia centrifuga]|uniref:Mitochondrial outer membrane protein IML2 n=1 Tax=Hermanssonia centrifuga TaxID=98765 RepID=A0A2R6NVI6_9APHY|nr:hypothetical protein PHLCEN_2v7793 [Hermanssonia centrifuga]